MGEYIVTQHHDGIYEIILNRDDKRNAVNLAMLDELGAAIDRAERIPGLRVVLVRSEGRGFCAGIDVTGFADMPERFGEHWRENLFPLTATFQGVLNKFEQSSLPVIAVIHGYCIGLGMELALACDFRIVAEGTRMSLPETRLGMIPDVGGTTRLTHLVGSSRAKEIIMTARNVDLKKAEQWGLINHLVSENDLLAKARELADEIKATAPLAVSYTKRVINDMQDIQRGLKLESWAQAQLFRTQDFEVGIQAAIIREQPEWTGK